MAASVASTPDVVQPGIAMVAFVVVWVKQCGTTFGAGGPVVPWMTVNVPEKVPVFEMDVMAIDEQLTGMSLPR